MNTLKIVFVLLVCCIMSRQRVCAQLYCADCPGRDTTSYTNGNRNDSLYFICPGGVAALRVNWSSSDLRNVQWYRFLSTTNTWTPVLFQPSTAIGSYSAGLGGYRVVVSDLTGNIVEEDYCWVSRVNSPPMVNANTIQPGCSSVQLAGLYFGGSVTGFYNLPPSNFSAPYLFNDNSSIEVCLDVVHPILSDLYIEIVSPPACGSDTIVLTETQTPLEPDSICFNSDANDLCFSNTTNLNYNLCALPNFDITGDFGAFGPNAQIIDWSPLLGCDVTQPGWTVNVRDCYESANGFITSASFTILELGNEIPPIVHNFETADGQDLTILDTGCDSSLFTSIAFERVYPQSTLLDHGVALQWVSDPPFPIPNNGYGMNFLLNPGPTVDTYFSLRLNNIQLGNACDSYPVDVEFFDYIEPDSSTIFVSDSILCVTDSPLLLTPSVAAGSWEGPVDSMAEGAVFDPSVVGPGIWNISFAPNSSCIEPTEVQIFVDVTPTLVLSEPMTLCNTGSPVLLTASPGGGVWSGSGLEGVSNDLFNPAIIAEPASELTYYLDGNCPVQASVVFTVESFEPLSIVQADTVICESAEPIDFDGNLANVQWLGAGISATNLGIFDPSMAGAGEHLIVANYEQACSSSDTVLVVVEDPDIDFVPVNPVCIDGEVLTLVAEADSGVWSGSGVVDSELGLFNPQAAGAGPQTVYFTLLNSCGSVDSLTLFVEDFPQLQLGLPDGICVDQSEFVLLANFEGGIFSGAGVQQIGDQWYFNPESAGVGSVELSYSYTDVCSLTLYDSIEVFPLPLLEISLDTAICPEGEALLAVSGAFQYGWSPAANLLTPTEASTIANPAETTTYTVSGQSDEGCFSLAQVTVEVFDSPVLSTNGPLELCPGDSEIAIVTGVEQAEWIGPDVSSQQGLELVVSPDSSTVYNVTGYDVNGCLGETNLEVIVHQPQAYFTASDTLGVPPLYVQFDNLSQGDYFIWDLGNGDTLVTTDLSEIVDGYYQGEEFHTVQLTAFLNGCPAYYSLELETYYDSELLIIPNIVTQDGDDKNDVWWVKTQNMKDLHVDIFNRWGQGVGTIDGINDRWDPSDFSAGTYYFRLLATGLDGEEYNREGSFTVLKPEK